MDLLECFAIVQTDRNSLGSNEHNFNRRTNCNTLEKLTKTNQATWPKLVTGLKLGHVFTVHVAIMRTV